MEKIVLQDIRFVHSNRFVNDLWKSFFLKAREAKLKILRGNSRSYLPVICILPASLLNYEGKLIDVPHSQRVKFFFIISQELSMIFQTYETIRAALKASFWKRKCCVQVKREKKNFIFLRKQKSNLENDYCLM